MMAQEQRFKQKQPYELDYSDLLRQAYWNCIMAYNQLETFAMGSDGKNMMKQELSEQRFDGTVSILDAMILDNLKDDTYRKDVADLEWTEEEQYEESGYHYSKAEAWKTRTVKHSRERSSHEIFKAVTELFNRKGILKEIVAPHARI